MVRALVGDSTMTRCFIRGRVGKIQINRCKNPNDKFQISNKFQNSNSKIAVCYACLFVFWIFEFIWNLVLGIWDFRRSWTSLYLCTKATRLRLYKKRRSKSNVQLVTLKININYFFCMYSNMCCRMRGIAFRRGLTQGRMILA